jgi:hypothetical protein
MEAAAFDTKPLLRPHQVEEAKSEIKASQEKLASQHIEDKAEVAKQLRRLQHSLETQMPRPPETPDEEGRMARRSEQLLAEILPGMPSQEEMRKAPPGAVDKHTAWEKRNKLKILEWKNLQLRLKPGEAEAANLERHRPKDSTLNMDNAYVPGKQFYLPPTMDGLGVAFNDEQLALLRQLNPAVAEMIGVLSNAQRLTVKDLIAKAQGVGLADESPVNPVLSAAGKAGAEKKKRVMSDKQKAALAVGRANAKAAKAAKE